MGKKCVREKKIACSIDSISLFFLQDRRPACLLEFIKEKDGFPPAGMTYTYRESERI